MLDFKQYMKRTIRRPELKLMVPLADSTIYGMEKAGTFPKRFPLTPRCVVWDYDEVCKWIEERKAANEASPQKVLSPDINKRKSRPVRAA
jgi:prophage regulatory protein